MHWCLCGFMTTINTKGFSFLVSFYFQIQKACYFLDVGEWGGGGGSLGQFLAGRYFLVIIFKSKSFVMAIYKQAKMFHSCHDKDDFQVQND